MMAVAVFNERESHKVYQIWQSMHTNTQKSAPLESCVITKLSKKDGKRTDLDKIYFIRAHKRPVYTT